MYKEQFFPGVNVSSSELKPGEPEAVEEPHKPEIEEQDSVRRINRRNFTLEDYAREWDIHPEWHGLSTQQATSKEGTASGLGAFYVSFGKFAQRESKGDETKRSEIMQQFFPEKQVKRAQYRLEDYVNEWSAHPEWHGFSTEQAQSGTAIGLGAFYASLGRFANRESKGDKEKRREIIERFFPFRVDKIYANRGYALQYSVETILKIISNKNLSIEAPVKRTDSDRHAMKPDLMYEYADGERALILDIKLQTTTIGIEKDKKNYSAILQNRYPRGGNLVFLCLNGPDFPSERLDDNDRVKVRYYHILDFLERLADNRRNKFLLRLISGNEEQEISQVPELTPEQIGKITEIADQLKVLQKVVSERSFSTEDLSLEDASEKTKEIRLQLSKLAKTKAAKENIAKIMSTDFKKLMDF